MGTFNTLAEAKVLIEQWRRHYDTVRPHSSLRYRPPAPEVILPLRSPSPGSPCTLRLRPGSCHAPLTRRSDPLVGAGQSRPPRMCHNRTLMRQAGMVEERRVSGSS
jgi:hypothetical protein